MADFTIGGEHGNLERTMTKFDARATIIRRYSRRTKARRSHSVVQKVVASHHGCSFVGAGGGWGVELASSHSRNDTCAL